MLAEDRQVTDLARAAHLDQTPSYSLAVYGARWDRPEYLEWRHRWRGILPLEEARAAYAGARVSLSIHNRGYLVDLVFATARPFHSLACGRATVSDTNAAMADLFPEESGLCHAATPGQFRAMVESLLGDAHHCAELGRVGRQFVLEHHTWDVRVGELLAAL